MSQSMYNESGLGSKTFKIRKTKAKLIQ